MTVIGLFLSAVEAMTGLIGVFNLGVHASVPSRVAQNSPSASVKQDPYVSPRLIYPKNDNPKIHSDDVGRCVKVIGIGSGRPDEVIWIAVGTRLKKGQKEEAQKIWLLRPAQRRPGEGLRFYADPPLTVGVPDDRSFYDVILFAVPKGQSELLKRQVGAQEYYHPAELNRWQVTKLTSRLVHRRPDERATYC